MNDPGGIPLHQKILAGMVLGILLGSAANFAGPTLEAAYDTWVAQPLASTPAGAWLGYGPETHTEIVRPLIRYVMEPVGRVFLNMLLLTVVPLVFASLATGVAQLGDLGKLGRMGAKTLAYFVLSMSLAVIIGLVLVNVIQPGASLTVETRQRLLDEYGNEAAAKGLKKAEFGINTFVAIVPRNPIQAAADMDMLAVIFVALLVGAGLTRIHHERARLLVQALEGVNELMVFIIGLAMKLAPYGVFAFLFRATATFGFELLRPLGLYVVVVLAGLALHMFGSFSVLVRLFSGLSPLDFFRRVRVVILTAFSTSSSNATLPTSIKVSEEDLGVPPEVAGFVLPLGATMNMNGTALFEGVTVVFLAQVYGVELTLGQQLMVVILSVLTAIGAAGVPGGSLPLLIMVLTTVGVPAEGIAIILGVDRLLDMCRTTLNVVGDITCATFIARSEGFALAAPPPSSGPSVARAEATEPLVAEKRV
jgi:dicarboxylate/amino acid:cation (Na+ or H+) symporter, DAACS family